jgi:hypothetical protein
MKQYLSILPALFFLLAACSSSAIEKQLAGSDSLQVTFNYPGSDSVTGIVNSTDTKAIQKLAGFLAGKESAKPNCGFDGNMIFYKNGQQVLPVVFKYSSPGCTYFMYESEGKLLYITPGNEAIDFLKSLGEGKGWY